MKTKGISLIVLVITILVLSMLAATVVISLSNTNIIGQANNAAKEYNMQTFKDAVNLEVVSYMAENKGIIDKEGLSQKLGQAGYNVGENGYGITVSIDGLQLTISKDGTVYESQPEIILERGGVIPEGATYYSAGPRDIDKMFMDDSEHEGDVGYISYQVGEYDYIVNTYTAGQTMPETMYYGDVFVYGDYEYRLGYDISIDIDSQTSWEFNDPGNFSGYYDEYRWDYADFREAYADFRDFHAEPGEIDVQNAKWGASVIDTTKTKYGTLCTKINGNDISLKGTFANCINLTSIPSIPSNVTALYNTFVNTTSLTTVNNLPDSIKYMDGAFARSGIKNITLPNNLRSMSGTFEESAIVVAPKIPNSVVDISYAFIHCDSLTTVNEIPEKVFDMRYAFFECYNLKGHCTVNAQLDESTEGMYFAEGVFGGVSGLTLDGTCPWLHRLLEL